MKTISINTSMGEYFGKKFIPKLYIRLLLAELHKGKYAALIPELKRQFDMNNVNFEEFINLENITVSESNMQYHIGFINTSISENLRLFQMINFINDGNLSFKGYNIFNKITSYINNNIQNIYMFYLMQGDKKWE